MTIRSVVKTTLTTDRSKFEPSRNAAETAVLLGFKNAGSLWGEVRAGRFVEPDFVIGGARGLKKAFWKLSTIQKILKERKQND